MNSTRILEKVRPPVDIQRLEAFMVAMGRKTKGLGKIYLTGGATALLYGWRPMTIDIDIKADPEPAGYFECIASIKNELELNVELACPSDFIPELPGWQERSLFIGSYGLIDFYHYDPYGQALAKLERGHSRDLVDVNAMINEKLISKTKLRILFNEIKANLIRYPSLDPTSFQETVENFCEE